MTETYTRFMDTFSDTMFLCSAYFTARRYVQRSDTWLYLFTQTPSTPDTGFFHNLGPVHTSEIPYVFNAFENCAVFYASTHLPESRSCSCPGIRIRASHLLALQIACGTAYAYDRL